MSRLGGEAQRVKVKPIVFCCIGLFLLGSGCQTIDEPVGLEVGLSDVRFVDTTALETTVDVTLRIDNEYPFAVVLSGAVHRITLNGLRLGKGMTGEKVDIPRLASTHQTVRMHISHLDVAMRLQTLLQSQVFDYHLKSLLYTETPSLRAKIRVQKEGRLDLRP